VDLLQPQGAPQGYEGPPKANSALRLLLHT